MWAKVLNSSYVAFFALLLSVFAYFFIGYSFSRQDFGGLFICFTVAFIAYWYLYQFIKNRAAIKGGYWLAFVLRLLFLCSIPMLSDDFYRFIWDGRLLVAGINPFSYVPDFVIHHFSGPVEGINNSLFILLNSPHYYSVYPPLCQAIFYLSSLAAHNSVFLNVIVLRLFVLGAEALGLIYLPKTLKRYNIPPHQGLIFALNPLVIIELTGNLHFEALMICFLILFFYVFQTQKLLLPGLFFGLAVITKLIPLLFLPLIFFRLGLKKGIGFPPSCFLLCCWRLSLSLKELKALEQVWVYTFKNLSLMVVFTCS